MPAAFASESKVPELGKDRKKWLVFASGIEHAEHITEILNDMGIRRDAIRHCNATTRNKMIADSRAEKVPVPKSGQQYHLTTGYDDPTYRHATVVLRPTMIHQLPWGPNARAWHL